MVSSAAVMQPLRERDAFKFFAVLLRADRLLGIAWFGLLALRGMLPALFAIAMGVLIAAVEHASARTPAFILLGTTFVLLQVLPPLHRAVSANLGTRTAAYLHHHLMRTCVTPTGLGHLEQPSLIADLTMARDFDLGISGPPLHVAMDFIGSALIDLVGGLASAAVLAAYAPWAPLVLVAAWGATHWLLRESAVWFDRNTPAVREAERHADYAYRLSVEPHAAKELRLFGLADFVIERFRGRRTLLFELQRTATRLRERPVLLSLIFVTLANLLVLGALAHAANEGLIGIDRLVMFTTAAVGVSRVAFGGLSWALDGASASAAAVLRLEPAMAAAGTLPGSAALPAQRAHALRFADVTFTYPGATQPVLHGFDLTIPKGTSLAIVGQNGAGKTTLAKLLCRFYDPTSGSIEVDGVDLRELDPAAWRARLGAVFQDYIRYELPLRDNVAPSGAPDDQIRAALTDAGALGLAELDTVLSRGYEGGTDLSGGQWQRIALARALCSVRSGAGVILLDEPTAQLDVRGEAAIFERILNATRDTTVILISHRFSTVRRADRICVLEDGRVVELGTHNELMALGGRYHTMFELQASRFSEADDAGVLYEQLA